MMTTRNKQDGGSAFPVWDSTAMHRIGMAASQDIEDSAERDREYIRATAQAAQGMTLRDHFAGLAMQAYLSGHDRGEFSYEEWAKASYEMADALIKVREAKS
ncbi:hypothetical protein ACCQ08_23120 [Comamonas sp. SY3]|uniref:hypothetical protein n=1 Tax=Comamonas sp. SY3 TaxID=3243601 RepID=UPI00359412AA